MQIQYTGTKPEKEIFQVFGETMRQLFQQDPRTVYLDADLMGSLKTQDLWKEYPNNVFNTGIQEADMIGVAAGLCLAGFKPYVHSFAPFVSRRVFDQAFISVAYAGKSVRIIGSDAGIMATHNGGTHMCFEDVALMRTVPNACIVDISDASMLRSFLRQTKDRPGLTYLRMPRRDLADIYPADMVFREGKGLMLKDGTDVTLIGCGIMVGTCLQAAQLLAQEGISAQVIDIVTIKPLDKELIISCAQKTGAIVTAENANVIGGLGSAVAELLTETKPVPVLKIGIKDQFGCVGTETFLRQKYGLTAQDIVLQAKKAVQHKSR